MRRTLQGAGYLYPNVLHPNAESACNLLGVARPCQEYLPQGYVCLKLEDLEDLRLEVDVRDSYD